MIEVSYSAATDQDLGAAAKGMSLGRNMMVGVVPVSVLVFGATYLISRSVVIGAAVSGILLIAGTASNVWFFSGLKSRSAMRHDPSAVKVISVEASQVVELEPLGSHEPAIAFFSDDGKALLLIGQWLRRQKRFPSKRFVLRCWADNRKPILVDSSGPKVKASHSTIQVHPKAHDIEFFNARPETLREDMEREFTARS